jgi:hypothetical protein
MNDAAINRNGGTDIHANEVSVGGDVVGRDKIMSTTYTSRK